MNVIGDSIVCVLHSGGIDVDGVVVDNYAIVLSSGRCIKLTDQGIDTMSSKGLQPDRAFDSFVGQRIIAIEEPAPYPSCVLRLSDGRALVMGSPHPYYFGLQQFEDFSDED